MSDDHSTRAGSLNAHLMSVSMEIDDDDEDVIFVVVDVVNESAIPVGGLSAALVTDKGVRYEPVEGITSIGPGLTRQFKFEAGIVTGTWSFEFSAGGQGMKLGPYEADFEFKAEQGRVMGNAIGTSLFSGAFDSHLGDFGSVEERGIINPDTIVMTSYVGESMEGGGTKVSQGFAAEAEDEEGPRTPPWVSSTPEPADSLLTTNSDPLLASPTPAQPETATPVLEAPPAPAADPLLTPLTSTPPAPEPEAPAAPLEAPPETVVETAATPPP
ncbi:MAG: hypothetical protein O3C36_02680, partial [archaeon]|nr:hypothetical protein [archaeon]